jgi:hypothetical protein
VFTESLLSNKRLLWLHYSGFQVSRHNIKMDLNETGYEDIDIAGLRKGSFVSEQYTTSKSRFNLKRTYTIRLEPHSHRGSFFFLSGATGRNRIIVHN